jgi:hypothetical protein
MSPGRVRHCAEIGLQDGAPGLTDPSRRPGQNGRAERKLWFLIVEERDEAALARLRPSEEDWASVGEFDHADSGDRGVVPPAAASPL